MTDEGYQDADALAREIREEVADQLHDLVVERGGLGSLDELGERVRRVVDANRQVLQAIARQQQAAEYGNPVARHAEAEREARELLRASVMSLGEVCGSAVVGMDFEQRRRRVGSRT